MTVSCSIVDAARDLSALEADYRQLLHESENNHPFTSWPWLDCWWQVWGPLDGRVLKVVVVRDGTQLIGVAPVLWRRVWHRGVVPIRRIEFLASGEREEDETCSDYIGVIARRGREEEVCEHVVDSLIAAKVGRWDELYLDALDGEALTTAALLASLRKRGVVVEETWDAARSAPYVSLPATWDDYLKGLSSSRRAFVRRSMRKFESWAEGDYRLDIAESDGQVETAMSELASLHGERWRQAGKNGVFSSKLFTDFHHRVALKLLAEDALELAILRVGDRPVAGYYNLVWHNKVYFYQSGRVHDAPKDVRLGIVGHSLLMQRAIELGRREYDFLAGMGDYAVRLSTGSRPIVRVRGYATASLAGLARRALEGAVDRARRLRESDSRLARFFPGRR